MRAPPTLNEVPGARVAAKQVGPVLLVGPHERSGPSMLRYLRNATSSYGIAGAEVRVWRPPTGVSDWVRRPIIAQKYAIYAEKFLLRGLALRRQARNVRVVHLLDQADAPVLWWLMGLDVCVVATIHDLVAVRAARGGIPEHRPGRLGRLYMRMITSALGRADLHLCASQATLADVQHILSSQSSLVLPMTLDDHWTVEPPRRSHVDPRGPYALVIASPSYRKARSDALRLFGVLRSSVTNAEVPKLRLRILGKPLDPLETVLCDELGITELVHVVSPGITDEDLRRLYANALVLIVTSRYEGFCWPIIEANSQGTMAICADSAVLHETGGDVNLYLSEGSPPKDWYEIAVSGEASIARRERAYTFSQLAMGKRWGTYFERLTEACQRGPSAG